MATLGSDMHDKKCQSLFEYITRTTTIKETSKSNLILYQLV